MVPINMDRTHVYLHKAYMACLCPYTNIYAKTILNGSWSLARKVDLKGFNTYKHSLYYCKARNFRGQNFVDYSKIWWNSFHTLKCENYSYRSKTKWAIPTPLHLQEFQALQHWNSRQSLITTGSRVATWWIINNDNSTISACADASLDAEFVWHIKEQTTVRKFLGRLAIY